MGIAGFRRCLAAPLPALIGIEAECESCGHKVVMGFERFLPRYGAMPFPALARLLKCSACGSRQVFARPIWPSQ
jgi:DNA-directed RNA polymerase subunit RPC12/RpoP